MIGTEIRSVEIQGFRAFGRKAQKFLFSSHIAAIWAPNSHGKTSLAEAFEFLLTGRIARRELMASTQDEFADALRNAHIPASDLVYVQAEIVGADDEVHVVRRTLIEDYGKRQDCQSKLEIDNAPATRDDLLALGIALAQPPLEAPVLAQHTLGYLFSARPQERASYFKALLEVTDLENLRTAVAALEAELQPLPDERLARLASAVSVAEARPFLEPLKASVPTREAIERAFQAAARALIEAAEASVPDDPKVRIDAVQEALASRRRAAFPVQGFEKQPLGEWVPPVETEWAKINAYLQERARVDEYSRRLTSLFREALALPALAQVRTAIDCPLCDTEEALTPERVDFIRQRVQETEHLQATQAEAKRALRELDRAIRLLITGVDASTPRFLRWSPHERRRNGFRVPRLRGVIGDDAASFVDPWIASARRFRRIRAGIKVRADRLLHDLAVYMEDPTSLIETTSLKHGLQDLSAGRQAFITASQQYLPVEQTLTSRLHAIIDTESRTTGWQELIDLARDPAGLRAALVEQAAHQTVKQELIRALTQIDRAKEKVLDGKFQDLSDAIQRWWNLLRPEEPTYFAALKQRPGARRTIDFKAGLSPYPDRSVTKVRDVIAVFSQSQLQCLGLALFIARATHEHTGFVILDDPVLSSDDDYRAHFNASVIEEVIDLPMQVIILTQDQKTWKDLEHRYLHRNIDMFQNGAAKPSRGSGRAAYER